MKKLTIWTARIDYKQKGDQLVLNTTATRGHGLGKLFAPTWELVETYKKGFIEWEEYERRYIDILREAYLTDKPKFVEVCEAGEVVLLCFCPDRTMTGKKCHRYLLADVLEKVAKTLGIEVTQGGERLTYTNDPNKHKERRKGAAHKRSPSR